MIRERPGSTELFDPVILNHGIAQHIARDGIEIFIGIERDLKKFPLPDILDPLMPQAVQRGTNGLALRIENRLFKGNVDACFHWNHIIARYQASSNSPICRSDCSFFFAFFAAGGANVRISASIF